MTSSFHYLGVGGHIASAGPLMTPVGHSWYLTHRNKYWINTAVIPTTIKLGILLSGKPNSTTFSNINSASQNSMM